MFVPGHFASATRCCSAVAVALLFTAATAVGQDADTKNDSTIEGFWVLNVDGLRNQPTLQFQREGTQLVADYADQFSQVAFRIPVPDRPEMTLKIDRNIDGQQIQLTYQCALENDRLQGTLTYQLASEAPKQRPVTGRRADETEIRRRRMRAGISYGPFLGDLTPNSVRIWYRAAEPGEYLLIVTNEDGTEPRTQTASADPARDLCLVWTVNELQPEQVYRYQIRQGDEVLIDGDEYQIQTPPLPETPQQVRLAFASCADEEEGTRRAWTRMRQEDPQTVVLLGDTPYIDTTDLAVQRMRYGQFAAVPEFAQLLKSRPLYGTWDDHDFGRNDTDGRLTGKEFSRQAFIEYHAMSSYGNGEQGIYTRFRHGGVDVFLLDARTWAGTEPSPADPNETTLLGAAQWKWLQDELKASTAPFKILATGMIWNGATRPNKTDHWMHYPHERAALFRFLKEAQITGVVLVGGDIHRTRALRHSTKDVAGYDLLELITSPMHDSIIEAANAPHPDLIFDAGEPHSFLIVDCNTTQTPPVLTARFLNADGEELFVVQETVSNP